MSHWVWNYGQGMGVLIILAMVISVTGVMIILPTIMGFYVYRQINMPPPPPSTTKKTDSVTFDKFEDDDFDF